MEIPVECHHIKLLENRLDKLDEESKKNHRQIMARLDIGNEKFEQLLQILNIAQGIGLTVKWLLKISLFAAAVWAAYSAWKANML